MEIEILLIFFLKISFTRDIYNILCKKPSSRIFIIHYELTQKVKILLVEHRFELTSPYDKPNTKSYPKTHKNAYKNIDYNNKFCCNEKPAIMKKKF